MIKTKNFNPQVCTTLILLLLLSNTLFSQQIPGPVKSGNRFVFYGAATKSIRSDKPGNETKPPLITVPFGTNRSIASNKQDNNQLNKQRPASPAAVITLATTVNQPSCGYNNGSIVVVASGGTPPYIYHEASSWPQNTGNFPMRSAGVYDITVTDADGNETTTQVILSNTLPPPAIKIVSYKNASTCTASDASVTLEGSGGKPPYQYSMDMVNFQTSNVFSGFTTGIYRFFVKDGNGCIASIESLFSITGSFQAPGCNGGYGFSYSELACGNTGTISPRVEYPNPPYTYSIDGVNYYANAEFKNLAPGIYPIYFKDALGNIRISAVSIFPHCYITINYITVDAACKQNDGVLTVTASNGTPPYSYTIDGINYQSSNTFTGLAPGIYFITARDANGETNSLGAVVYDRCPAVTATATGETCAKNDGTITATATKGTSPYQYSIDGTNFQPGNSFAGLTKGNYTVTLKDALGFTSTTNAVVNDECISVTAAAVNSTCGNSNGQITASAIKGTPPYQYSIDGINFQADNIFTGVKEGSYTVNVKDIAGKTGTANITVYNTPGPQITLNANPESCDKRDGSIMVTGSGGRLPFQYSLDNTSYQDANVFNNLIAGDYTVWIKDANQCTASQTIRLVLSCPTVTAVGEDETCNSGNGSITATGTNGTPPYLYSLDGINFQNNKVFTGLKAGVYTITIKDALAVTNSTSVLVENICPTVSVVVSDGLCGEANGKIIATGADGTAPYQYSIDGINFQGNNTFNDLASAIYTVTVKDAKGLINTNTAAVKNFLGPNMTLDYNPASCLNNDGNITVTAIGGTSPLQYSVMPGSFQHNPVFNGLSKGDYTVTIKDANNCTFSQPITVELTNNLTLTTGNEITICEGQKGKLPATSNGASFIWTPSANLDNNLLLNPQASPAITTKYFITASLGLCTIKDSVSVLVNSAPMANAGKDSTICFGQSVQLNGSGGLYYQWSPASYLSAINIADPFVNKPSQSVTYSLKVTDINGCESTQPSSVTITVTPLAKVFAGNDTSVVMNEPFQLMAMDVNNSGFVKFRWSPAYGLNNTFSPNPVTIPDRDMTYTVMASTPAGCEGYDEIKLKVYQGPEIYVPTAFTPNNDGKNDILKAIPIGIKEFKYFSVLNRWGNKVFYSVNPNIGWNGTIGNLKQDTGVYVWVAEGKDNKGNIIKRKGTVTVIR